MGERANHLAFFFFFKPYSGLVICTASFQGGSSRNKYPPDDKVYMSILGWGNYDLITLVQNWVAPSLRMPNPESEAPSPNTVPV